MSHWSFIWKALVAFYPRVHQTIRCTPDSKQCVIPFLVWQSRPLLASGPMAHWTVRCGLVTVGWAYVAPADHAVDRWLSARLTHQTVRWIIAMSAFWTQGVPGPTSKLSPRAPAQMGRRETEREGGKKPEGDTRKRGNPWPSCLSRAQVGCACSRGLQASTWEGERGLRERRPVLPRAANPL
jgi:hypothetical protein